MNGYLIGLDVGTTTISGIVISISNKKAVESFTTPNDSWIDCTEDDIFEQNANKIYTRIKSILNDIMSKYKGIQAIGITGQMHGILYVDNNGEAVSPFMIWQDRRAGRRINDGETYCDRIFRLCGEKVAVGYGLATHYYNVCNCLIPDDAIAICSITDYIAMQLTKTTAPIIHSSMAGSLGLYDAEKECFKTEAIKTLGLDCVEIPLVVNDYTIVGDYRGIPVAVGIGDNQASFLGTVDDLYNSILVNIGTGSQISFVTDECKTDNPDLEIRPLSKGKQLLCGCALSGGASYAMLEKFFRKFNFASNGKEVPQYDVINKLALAAYDSKTKPLHIDTFFRGKRSDANATGTIMGITDSNFTPEAVVLGFIHGMCRELYDFLGDSTNSKTRLIASGNAVQKNPVFKKVLSDMFQMPVYISDSKEEASIGAALFAGLSAGVLKDESEFEQYIKFDK